MAEVCAGVCVPLDLVGGGVEGGSAGLLGRRGEKGSEVATHCKDASTRLACGYRLLMSRGGEPRPTGSTDLDEAAGCSADGEGELVGLLLMHHPTLPMPPPMLLLPTPPLSASSSDWSDLSLLP